MNPIVLLAASNIISLLGVAVMSYRISKMEMSSKISARILTGVVINAMEKRGKSRDQLFDEMYDLANDDYSFVTSTLKK